MTTLRIAAHQRFETGNQVQDDLQTKKRVSSKHPADSQKAPPVRQMVGQSDWLTYRRDVFERTILFCDVLRRRANGQKLLIIEGDGCVLFSLERESEAVAFLTQCLEEKVA